MNTVERVRHLVEAGTVGPDEGERLLSAINRESAHPRARLLINPFDRFGGGTAAAVGAVVSVLSLGVTRLGMRYDGLFDLHIARGRIPPLPLSIAEQGFAWILPAACFFAYARLRSSNVRAIDFVGMVGLARLPLLLASLPAAMLAPAPTTPIKMTPSLLGIAMIGLAGAAWTITLLYQGFKNASGFVGAKLVGGFVVTTVVAEALSKLVLALAS